MPAKPRWLLHLPEIIAEMAAIDAPAIDRATIERLFLRRSPKLTRPYFPKVTQRF